MFFVSVYQLFIYLFIYSFIYLLLQTCGLEWRVVIIRSFVWIVKSILEESQWTCNVRNEK